MISKDMSSYYGFNFSTLTCNTMNLDHWMSVFGLEDEDLANGEPDEVAAFWFSEAVGPMRLLSPPMDKKHSFCSPVEWRPFTAETYAKHETCDSDICRMTAGVCVDCSRCSRHCECVTAKEREAEELLRSVCTLACKPIVCSDCTRCTDHCTCRLDAQRQSSLGYSISSHSTVSNTQYLERNLSWSSFQR